MEHSPQSSRSIQEFTGSSSSVLQPFINLNDRRSLQGQVEISALEQQQQLYDCEKEQISLQNQTRVLLELTDNSDMRLQELEDGTNMNVTRLTTCIQEKVNQERDNAALENAVKAMKEQLEHFETAERLHLEQLARSSDQLESLQRENSSINIKLHQLEPEDKALSKEIENLQMQLNGLLPIERRNTSPISESKHSTSTSAEVRNILDIMGCGVTPKRKESKPKGTSWWCSGEPLLPL